MSSSRISSTSGGGASGPLNPTWWGYVETTMDACILFEACLQGRFKYVPRRPHEKERQELIRSGNIFIYEEHASSIKRWTDGKPWSPSRILNNFMIYRELDEPVPPGEKKRALKKNSQQGIVKSKPSQRTSLPVSLSSSSIDTQRDNVVDEERALIGSLIDSYPFKEHGLIKKTISITYNYMPHHLVSYYSVDDVLGKRLPVPTDVLSEIVPRSELTFGQNFRAPMAEIPGGIKQTLDAVAMGYYVPGAPAYLDYGHAQHPILPRPVASLGFHNSIPGSSPVPPAYNAGQVHHFNSGYMPLIPGANGQGMAAYGQLPQPQPVNYALDTARHPDITVNEMSGGSPRNMPLQAPVRRQSGFGSPDGSEMNFSGYEHTNSWWPGAHV